MFVTKMKLIVLAACVTLLFTGSLSMAAGGDSQVDFVGLRGINVTLHKHPTAVDLDRIAGWGANLIRLVINADPQLQQYDGFYLSDGKAFNEAAFKEIDSLLALAAARKISVIIDTHSFPGMISGAIWEDFRYWDRLEALWVFIAQRYKDNRTVIGYEPFNEPAVATKNVSKSKQQSMLAGKWTFPAEWKNTPKDYFQLVERIGQAINKIDSSKAVIVDGVGMFGHPVNFYWMHQVNVNNVIYSFHMYIPHNFTHSGIKGRPIGRYDSRTGRSEVLQVMAPVKQFARAYKAQIFVGEFGLTCYTEGQGAGEWLSDVLNYLEENGWPWTYWNYSSDTFGPDVVCSNNDRTKSNVDTERLKALKEYWAKNKMRL